MAAQPPTGATAFAPFGSAAALALVNDEPVAAPGDDILGTGRAAAQLARLLRASRASTPFTLAVDAGWGMGKSSLMRLVDARLRAEPDVETVWYNAWTSTGADALEGLVKSVLVRFERRTLKRALARISRGRAVVRGVRAATTALGGALGAAGLVDELWTSWAAGPEARNGMREDIARMAREWGEAEPRRLLVVFIDDLDRCPEDTVLAVCEALKVYLDVPGLVFVVGCDRSALGPSGLLRDLSPAGSAFMEKIFQTSYRIPVADNEGVRAYVEWCARTAGIEGMLDDGLKKLLVERSGRNPRRIKRLVNGFVLEATLNPVWQDFPPEAVIRTLLLQYFYPEFYRMMTGASGAPGGDVVQEFTAYRRVRRSLLSPDPEHARAMPDLASQAEVGAFLAQYDVFATAEQDGAQALEQLERRLPIGFPEHADDPGFTSLLEELLKLRDAERLLVLLREGMPATVEPPGYEAPPPSSSGSQSPYPSPYETPYPPQYQQPAPIGYPQAYPAAYQTGSVPGAVETRSLPPQAFPLSGLRVLWVGKPTPESSPHRLEVLGAGIVQTSGGKAERHLTTGRVDLLVCHLDSADGSFGQLDDVQAWRDSRLYTGPVVILSSRITPELRDRAEALGALLAKDVDELLILAQRTAVPFVPAPQRSAGPPA